MELHTTVAVEEDKSLTRVALRGALNSETAPGFETDLTAAIAVGMHLTVLDMKELDYISSAGLRVIFKASKSVHNQGRRLAAANRQPQIDKVFEILQALPDMAVFADDQEMDEYLDEMQKKAENEPRK